MFQYLDTEERRLVSLENLDACKKIISEGKRRQEIQTINRSLKNLKNEFHKKACLIKRIKYEIREKSVFYEDLRNQYFEMSSSNCNPHELDTIKSRVNYLNHELNNLRQIKTSLQFELESLRFEIILAKENLENKKPQINPGAMVFDMMNSQSITGYFAYETFGMDNYGGKKLEKLALTKLIEKRDSVNNGLQKRLDKLQSSSNHAKQTIGYLGEYVKNIFF